MELENISIGAIYDMKVVKDLPERRGPLLWR